MFLRPQGGGSVMHTEGKLIRSDAEILQLVAGGDDDAFRMFIERYEARVMTYLSHYLEPYRAEDIAQETFFCLFRRISLDPNFQLEGEKLEALLITIAGGAAIDELRRESRREEVHDQSAIFPPVEPRRLEDFAIAVEIGHDVQSAVAKLPPKVQMVADLSLLKGYKTTEVARLTRSSIGAVRGRLAEARQFLRDYLEPYRKGVSHDV